MPDLRRHRGPHPEDAELFHENVVERLRSAVVDYCYLLDRGYASPSSLKLVGDRFKLRERQRTAINRSTCSQAAVHARRARMVPLPRGGRVLIDGFNLLTTIEAALAGGVLIVGREGCVRDMASMHGSYRRVEETVGALELIAERLEAAGAAQVDWFFDQPVSNSGRLATFMRSLAAERQWPWHVELVPDPDRLLVAASDQRIVTADREILDGCGEWINLAAEVVECRSQAAPCWLVHLGDAAPAGSPEEAGSGGK